MTKYYDNKSALLTTAKQSQTNPNKANLNWQFGRLLLIDKAA
jgi:hypothetical protein